VRPCQIRLSCPRIKCNVTTHVPNQDGNWYAALSNGRDRVRTCVIRYFLEDSTVDVCEPKTDNSGIVQGRLLKRHRAPVRLAQTESERHRHAILTLLSRHHMSWLRRADSARRFNVDGLLNNHPALSARPCVVASTGEPLTFQHLQVGTPCTIYGRTFHITACDAFTRAFLQREGIEVAPDTAAPQGLDDEGNVCSVSGAIGRGLQLSICFMNLRHLFH